jgi:hypothetical protein
MEANYTRFIDARVQLDNTGLRVRGIYYFVLLFCMAVKLYICNSM